MSRNISIPIPIGMSRGNLNMRAGRRARTSYAFDGWRKSPQNAQLGGMDSIKGAIELAERLAHVALPTPAPNPRVPENAPPIFHWLGVKPPAATGLPSSSRAV